MRTMDLDSLEIFRTVVTEGGVIRAAQKLNRVQSNVTTRIRQLEARLGQKLFHRHGRSLVLSPEGRLLLSYTERLFPSEWIHPSGSDVMPEFLDYAAPLVGEIEPHPRLKA